MGSLSLDAGEQNQQFRNVRVSCIAGPCPFTAIESDRFSRGGHSITVSVRNWSDRVTYLLEAEVVHTMESEMIRMPTRDVRTLHEFHSTRGCQRAEYRGRRGRGADCVPLGAGTTIVLGDLPIRKWTRRNQAISL